MTTEEQTNDLKQREEWFLSELDKDPVDLAGCLAVLEDLARGAIGTEQVDSLAELLQETLGAAERGADALKVLEFRAESCAGDRKFKRDCEKLGLAMLGNTPENRALFKNAGFKEDIDVRTCFDRLRLLMNLAPGILCYEKTWGFGIVSHVDHFYEKVVINFDKKKEHEMQFGYASQTLELIGEDHILAIKHGDGSRLQDLADNDPAEVVRIAINSYGPLNATQLIEKLVPDVIPETTWKRFWDAARKDLKKDPLVHLPTRRSEPIELLHVEKSYDEKWFDQLAAERNMEQVLKLIEEFMNEIDGQNVNPSAAEIMRNRLAFVILGAGAKQPGLSARAVMALRDLGLDDKAEEAEETLHMYLKPDLFLRTLEELSASHVRRFLEVILEDDREAVMDLWLRSLPEVDTSVLSDLIDLLSRYGREEECAEIIRHLVRKQAIDVDLLAWIWRNPKRIDSWSLGNVPQLADLTLRALELDHVGARLRVQNQLRDRFKQHDWVKTVLGAMDEKVRRAYFIRVKESTAWPDMDHRSVMGHIIKIFPELEHVMKAPDAAPADGKPSGPMTSHRSYVERQKQLERIVQIEIPKNSKEIGVARSYGDLRENHEFKAAKEMQGILLRRQAEFEKMLVDVKPTDFLGFPHSEVGMGTGVVLQYPDGKEEEYYILGAWDRDEQLGIISSETKLAGILLGHKEGDEVDVPTETGSCRCRLSRVMDLPELIRQWINDTPVAAS